MVTLAGGRAQQADDHARHRRLAEPDSPTSAKVSRRPMAKETSVDGLEERACGSPSRTRLSQGFETSKTRVRPLRRAPAAWRSPAVMAAGPCRRRSATSQQATCDCSGRHRARAARRGSARTRCAQRGWKAQPGGMASSRGIAPGICTSRVALPPVDGDRAHQALGVGVVRRAAPRRAPGRSRRCGPRTSRPRGRRSRRSRPCRG